MSSLEIYEVRCEENACTARATWRLRTDAGTFHFYCRKHAGPALIAANKAEKGKKEAKS